MIPLPSYLVSIDWLSDRTFFPGLPKRKRTFPTNRGKMGLITHNSAVTLAEKEHGHRCTYTLDTWKGMRQAGLKILKREGIFLKRLQFSMGSAFENRYCKAKSIWRAVFN